jgi:hypothetical protein
MDAPPRLKNRHFSLRILPQDGRNSPNSANELSESKSATLTLYQVLLEEGMAFGTIVRKTPVAALIPTGCAVRN